MTGDYYVVVITRRTLPFEKHCSVYSVSVPCCVDINTMPERHYYTGRKRKTTIIVWTHKMDLGRIIVPKKCFTWTSHTRRKRGSKEYERKKLVDNSGIDTLLFADDQAILSNLESSLQMAVHSLDRIWKDFGLQISTLKTKEMALHKQADLI